MDISYECVPGRRGLVSDTNLASAKILEIGGRFHYEATLRFRIKNSKTKNQTVNVACAVHKPSETMRGFLGMMFLGNYNRLKMAERVGFEPC